MIMEHYNVNNWVASLTFSIMFALSCNGFLLLIFEALEFGLKGTRFIFWDITIKI